MDTEAIDALVRRSFDIWVNDDEAGLEAIIAPDFTFTSPNDDHLDRAAFWEVC